MLTTPDSVTPVSRFSPVPDWTLAPTSGDTETETAAKWQRRVEEVATRLLESDEALSDPRWHRSGLTPGLGTGPRFIIEDHSEIPLSPPERHTLEYRMAWLARSSDLMGLAEARVPAFEHLLAQHYGLGQPRYIRPRPGSQVALAARFAEDGLMVDTLVGLAAGGGLSVVPYISTTSVWLLAERLAALSGKDVRVSGPPPELTDRVNNKLWFAQRVRELIGPDALPKTHVASDDRELVVQLDGLATMGKRLVVKVPAASGGRGIVVCEAASVLPGRVEAAAHAVRSALEAGGWDGSFPLVVGLWDEPVVASPSVQVWVPRIESGLPIVEAVFDQVLDDARFVGATESTLPVRVRERLSSDAMGLALLLQRLGYFGRCGFDAVLVGDLPDTATVHWLECNGRWGSVSTALSAVRRLVGHRPDRSVAIVQNEVSLPQPRSFEEVMALLDADLLHNRADRTGAVLLSPRRVMAGTGVNLAVIERSGSIAQETVERVFHRLAQP